MKFIEYFSCLWWIFLNCNQIILYTSASGSMADLRRLNEHLFSNYSREMRPVEKVNDTLTISTMFLPINILDVDEISGRITLSAGMCMFWNDFQLSWEPSHYGGINNIMVNSSKVWKPSLFIMSSASDMDLFSIDQYDVRINNTGGVDVCPGRKITSSCSIDMTNFPTDSQNCFVIVTPWGYNSAEIKLLTPSSTFFMRYFHPNGEWNVDKTLAEEYSLFGSESSFLAFRMILSRKPTYFVLSLIIPVYILCVLNPFVFLLPVSSGERISYTITIFLSLAVYMTLIGDSMPKVSEPMAGISYFLVVAMLFNAFLVILSIFTIRCDAVTDVNKLPVCLLMIVRKTKCRLENHAAKSKGKVKDIAENQPSLDSAFGMENSCAVMEKDKNQMGFMNTCVVGKTDATDFLDMALFFITQFIVIVMICGFSIAYLK